MNKINKILAIGCSVCLLGSTAALAACSKSGSGSIKYVEGADLTVYTKDYSEYYDYDLDGVTAATKTDLTPSELSYYRSDASSTKDVIVRTVEGENGEDDTYRLYNVATGKYLTSASYTYVNSNYVDSYGVWYVQLSNGDYAYIDLLGNTVATIPSTADGWSTYPASSNYYIDGDSSRTTVYCIYYYTTNSSGTKTYTYTYYYCEVDEDYVYTGKAITVKASQLSNAAAYEEPGVEEFGFGDDYDGALKGYSVKVVNNVYTFYDASGNETGTLEMTNNMQYVGMMKSYYYYYVVEDVNPEAETGYVYDYGEKLSYTLYRYDMTTGTSETIDPGYYIYNVNYLLFNNETCDYDAMVVYACDYVDGVAYVNGATAHIYVINADGEVLKDITTAPYSSPSSVYKLDDTHYYYRNYILDENLDVTTYLGSVYCVYPELSLVRLSSGNYVDYDGNLVISAQYSAYSQYVYGGYAIFSDLDSGLVDSETVSGTSSDYAGYYIIKSDGTTKALTTYESTSSTSTTDVVYYANGLIITLTSPTTESTDTNRYTFKVYNYAGTLIGTYSSSNSYFGSSYNNKVTSVTTSDGDAVLYLSIYSYDEASSSYVTTVYKLS